MTKPKKKQPSKGQPFPIWIGVLVGLVVLAAAGILIFGQPGQKAASTPMPDTVSVAQAAALRSQGAFILDVRQPEEWNQFHIPGATLIPLGDLSSRLTEVPKDQNVVVYCRTGVRSAQGRDILRQAGYTQVTSLEGGITAWQAQGEPVAAGS